MTALSVPVVRTLLKQQDGVMAERLGCSVETVRSYRLGKRRVPDHLLVALRRLRAERLRKAIAAMQQELADAEAGL